MFARSALLTSALVIPAVVLSACSGTKAGYGDPQLDGFAAVNVTSDNVQTSSTDSKAPTITWNGAMSYPSSTQTKTLVQGTGATVSSASTSVDTRIYVASEPRDLQLAQTACQTASASTSSSPSATKSASKSASKSSKSATPSASSSASSSASATPTPTPVTECSSPGWPLKGSWAYQTSAGSYDAFSPKSGTVWASALQGAKIGSRIAVVTTSADVFGDSGAPTYGIGNHDPLIMIVDLARLTPVQKDRKVHDVPAKQLPKLVVKNGKPTSFDFTGIKKPATTDLLKRVVVKKGTGATVTAKSKITVNYIGQTYKAKKPFNDSYTSTPLTQQLSKLIEGWKTGLVGLKVGSRVLLQIPPAEGYGSTAQSGIPADSTLWFAIDIVSAK